METKKYSIVINNIQGESYALVLKSWLNDIEGKEIDVVTVTKINLTLQECITESQNFINNGL
jgi:hypothetical protein